MVALLSMKSVVIHVLKLVAVSLITTVAYIAVSLFIPFSEKLVSANQAGTPSILLYLYLFNLWICLVMMFLAKQPDARSERLWLMSSLVLITAVMPQVETLFFHDAFPVLTTSDVLFFILSASVPILVGFPLCLRFFHRVSDIQSDHIRFTVSLYLVYKLGIIGLAYVGVYFVFGYFVAWQEIDLRLFYSGSTEDNGFFGVLKDNLAEMPMIYPFQFVRGVLFGLFVLPVIHVFQNRKHGSLWGLVIVLISAGMGLIIPNVLFPDSVRWAHFREMMTSMSFFAIVIWWTFKNNLTVSAKNEKRIH